MNKPVLSIVISLMIAGVLPQRAMPQVTWSQPPLEIDPNVAEAVVLCGWNEAARSTQAEGLRRQWRMDTDDFRCCGPMPVTGIRWWGGYKGWQSSEPPSTPQPTAWHIGFWGNMVEGLEPNDLYPERLVWSLEVPRKRVECQAVGLDRIEDRFPEMCFVCDVNLAPEEWFHPDDFTTNDDVFWISITAIYPTGAEAINMWGWHTRPQLWGRGGMMPAIMGEWPDPEERLFPGRIYPIESARQCGDARACDLCFELFTAESQVHHDEPFTGLRDWPWYTDEMVLALEPNEQDVLMLRRVADELLCERSAPVVAVSWHGSYLGHAYEACGCEPMPEPRRPDYFFLSLSTSAPADDWEPYAHPGETVWEYVARNCDEVLVGYDKNPEGEPNEPVFRYSVRLPEDAWFLPASPGTRYWFSVVPVFLETGEDRPYDWGWANHPQVSDSGTLLLDYRLRTVPQWQPVRDPVDRPVDMSFTLYAGPDPNAAPAESAVTDD